MKIKYLILLIIFFILIKFNSVYSQKLLLIGRGDRAIGLGEAYVAFPEELNVMNYNPAGLGNLKTSQLSLMHVKWIDDISYEYVSYCRELNKIGVAGINLRYLSYPKFDFIDIEGNKGGKIGESSFVLTAGIGRKCRILNDNLGGINVKLIQSRLVDYSSWSMAMDAGVLTFERVEFLTFNELKTGLAIRDLGINFKPAGEEAEKLPTRLALGFSANALNLKKLSKNHVLRIAVEAAIKIIERDEGKFHIGMEYLFRDRLYIRSGYKFGETSTGFSLGCGLNSDMQKFIKSSKLKNYNIEINYSFAPYINQNFGVNHNVAMTLKFPEK